MLKAALHYRNKYGFSLIPCKTDKRPIVKWEQHQREKPSVEQIKKWWTKYPYANIGIITGEISGIDVLDCDTEEAYQSLNENFLPDTFQTPIVKTPNGYHVYFKHKPGLSNAVRAISGTDLRTTGGYVIAPPSKNGDGNKYVWFEGLSPKDVDPNAMPAFLFNVLKQGLSININNNNINANVFSLGGQGKTALTTTTTMTTMTTFLTEGQRDNDLFHTANCLIKGGCSKEITAKVLEILAKNCNPPFSEKEINLKVQSALDRNARREKNLTQEICEVFMTTNDNIMTTNIAEMTTMTTREDKKKMYSILSRLVKEGFIEKVGDRGGCFRRVDKDVDEMDWVNAKMDYLPFWIPLGISEMAGLLPGNISIIAGSKDSGKTAWLMNISKENRHKYKVHYFNSEMGPAEFRLRVSKFDDITPNQWHNFRLISRSDNFADVIEPGPGNLNIIDFIEVHDNFYKVAEQIKKIHDKLKGALAFIAIQKNYGVDLGRGGSFSLEKARLYISLDKGVAKIISAKNFKQESVIGNPSGYQCFFKLVGGIKIIKDRIMGWHSPGKVAEND